MAVRASIDLGTNTCLLLLAEWEAGAPEPKKVLGDFSTIVRLGEGVDQAREFKPEAMERTLKCLSGYSEKIKEAGLAPSLAFCVATSSSRDSKNGKAFFDRIRNETGLEFRIISGEDEARLTFLGGLLPGMGAEKTAVIDIGGGSTELISLKGGQSLDMGSVRFTERFLKSDPVTDDEFWNCQEAIDSELSKLSSWRSRLSLDTELLAVAGTATTLAQWFINLPVFNAAKIDQVCMTRGDVHRMVEDLKWRTVKERISIVGIEPKRADVILAGAMILWRAQEGLNFAKCRVSTRGLRYGVMKEFDSIRK
ncbi:MAG: Ppx/GppA phosphatase family protein [Bdellovibrionota bacterium]